MASDGAMAAAAQPDSPRLHPFTDSDLQKLQGDASPQGLEGASTLRHNRSVLRGDDSAFGLGGHAEERLLVGPQGSADCGAAGRKQPRWRQWLDGSRSQATLTAPAAVPAAPDALPPARLRRVLSKHSSLKAATVMHPQLPPEEHAEQAQQLQPALTSTGQAADAGSSSGCGASDEVGCEGLRQARPQGPISGQDEEEDPARLGAKERARAWLAHQQERWHLPHLRRPACCVAPPLSPQPPKRVSNSARSDSGDSHGSSAADGCVRVYVGGVQQQQQQQQQQRLPPPALEPVTLGDVWHDAGGPPAPSGAFAPSPRSASCAQSEVWFDAASCFGSSQEPGSPSLHADLDGFGLTHDDVTYDDDDVTTPRRDGGWRPQAPECSPHLQPLPPPGAPGSLQPGPHAWLPPQPARRPAQDGPHVPSPPLLLADREYEFVPVPRVTGFAGYWVKDLMATTPCPQPIDSMLGASKMVQRSHETIPGIWLQEGPNTFSMTAKPKSIPLGPLSRYTEPFAKDGSTTYWPIRRDIKVGRSAGQLYFTACGTLVFRVVARGVFSSEPEWVCEEYSRLEEGGRRIVSLQRCKHLPSGRTAEQYLVGSYYGSEPPRGEC